MVSLRLGYSWCPWTRRVDLGYLGPQIEASLRPTPMKGSIEQNRLRTKQVPPREGTLPPELDLATSLTLLIVKEELMESFFQSFHIQFLMLDLMNFQCRHLSPLLALKPRVHNRQVPSPHSSDLQRGSADVKQKIEPYPRCRYYLPL